MKDKKLICINETNDISLDAHAVIEASAGTGKTFTIKNLVARIIEEKNADINEILVLTFTEAAAGELKTRIRSEIENRIKNSVSPEIKNKFINVLDKFDSNQIWTIHGFCNYIINEFPFENKQYFIRQVVNDDLIFEKVLHDIMRNKWRDQYKEYLNDLLLIADFNENSEDMIIKLSKLYKDIDGFSDKIIPPEDNDLLSLIKKIKNEIKNLNCNKLIDFFKNNSDFYNSDFYLNIINNNDEKFNDNFYYLFLLINSFVNNSDNILNTISIINFLSNNKKNFIKKMKSLKFDNEDYQSVIDNINLIIEKMLLLDSSIVLCEKKFISNAVVDLKKISYKYKSEKGLISFDDMLKNVYLSLKDNDNLKIKLQNKYKYALVDEFQDTDKLQWEILKLIFLNNKYNKIFLIADPKQSIYGFRGADLNAYLNAKKNLESTANFYFLDKNWRTNDSLLKPLNSLFGFYDNCANVWFNDERIIKLFSKASDINKFDYEDDKAKNLIFIDLKNCTGNHAKIIYAGFIVNEIKRIINFNITENINGENKIRKMKYDDIAVVARSTNDKDIIEKFFKDNLIPYSFYKKDKLFDSKEAFHLAVLIDAITDPADQIKTKKALLTRFFDYNLNDLMSDTVIKSGAGYFSKWHNLAIKKDFFKMFYSIIKESEIYIREIKKIDGERRVANFRHIIERMIKDCVDNDFNIFDLNNHLNNLINSDITEGVNNDLHRLETEEPKVKILTIHASKGLEFPIVFVFGGLTSGNKSDYYKYYEDDNVVYDLLKSKDKKDLHKKEIKNEDQRLYYVAFTRAISRLYIPFYTRKKNDYSPFGEFIKECQDNTLPDEKVKNNITVIKGDYYFKADNEKLIETREDNKLNYKIPDDFLNEFIFDFNGRKDLITSFSSLNKKHYENEKAFEYEFKKDYAFIEDEINKDIIIDDNKLILKKGPETGSLIHNILEKIDFMVFKKNINDVLLHEKTIKIIKDNINYYKLISKNNTDIDDNLLLEEIIKILHIVLNKNIDNKDQSLKLIEIKNKINEFEFYFNIKNNDKEIFINGFIDLVFNFNDKYYILDWKTNYFDNYENNSLKNEMDKSNYNLQLKIYTVALIRWLNSKLKDFNFNVNFGGIFYLFLRGINKDNHNGIFHYIPSGLDELNNYEKEILFYYNKGKK